VRRANLQVKFGLSYILVIAAVLVFMNTYPLIVSENLVVRSKQTTLQSSVSVMVTALSGLEELSEENVASAMTLVEDTGISRILVTDAAGRILYDTRETDGAVGRYGLYTEIVQALRGYDAFYADFTDGAFRSRAASPVIYRSQTIGAVYAYEYDVEQATLLLTLQKNLLRISAAVAGFVVLLSLLLSRMLTRRFGVLLEAIRRVREGAYSYHAEIGGRDEISEIAEEFNSLSDRLQTTEEARRRFVSDASHELKTPLAGIRLLSDSILQTEDIDAATVREFVGDIVQETDRLTRITENLLRLTRLDSGIVEPAQSVAVAPVIERVVRMLRLVADEKRVELTYLVEREQSVRAGVDDLHQIIYNLTENAIKYNRPGGFVRVTLGGTGKDTGKRHPTVGNNVMISAGAKVLGPFKIGDNSRVAAGAVVLEEVPPNCTVVGVPARIVRQDGKKIGCASLDQIHIPDPVKQKMECLEKRISELEKALEEK